MIRKIIFTNYFSEFIHKVAIKFRFRKALQKKCFRSDIILDTRSFKHGLRIGFVFLEPVEESLFMDLEHRIFSSSNSKEKDRQ